MTLNDCIHGTKCCMISNCMRASLLIFFYVHILYHCIWKNCLSYWNVDCSQTHKAIYDITWVFQSPICPAELIAGQIRLWNTSHDLVSHVLTKTNLNLDCKHARHQLQASRNLVTSCRCHLPAVISEPSCHRLHGSLPKFLYACKYSQLLASARSYSQVLAATCSYLQLFTISAHKWLASDLQVTRKWIVMCIPWLADTRKGANARKSLKFWVEMHATVSQLFLSCLAGASQLSCR